MKRQIKRNILKRQIKTNHINTTWKYLQIKRYGFEKWWSMRVNCDPGHRRPGTLIDGDVGRKFFKQDFVPAKPIHKPNILKRLLSRKHKESDSNN